MISSESSKIIGMMEAPSQFCDQQMIPAFMPFGEESKDSNMDNLLLLLADRPKRPLTIKDLPNCVIQSNIFRLFTSKELFQLRLVCSEWNDLIKTIWCQVVKEEMLEQVQNLDLLYEKETTTKLLEFKLKYLVSYA